ncbi:lamin-A-like [Mugil cephalus]|uniref:lamin-A-like n=1 Tax=Mugil cephalus TaxID=48193 RepID=UPI001FB79450|nr:lamin-A-like [Mugil cephalus]
MIKSFYLNKFFQLEKNKPAASWSIWPFKSSRSNKQKEESETIKPEQTQNSSSSDSQETSGDVIVVVNANYNCICLRNESDQDKPLGGRQLKVQINNSEPITYTFDPSMKLKAGKSVTIYCPDHKPLYFVPGDLVWKDLKSWKSGDRVQVSLQ